MTDFSSGLTVLTISSRVAAIEVVSSSLSVLSRLTFGIQHLGNIQMFFGNIEREIQIGQRIILNTDHGVQRETPIVLKLELVLSLAQSFSFDARQTIEHMFDLMSPTRCHLLLLHVDLSRYSSEHHGQKYSCLFAEIECAHLSQFVVIQ